MSARFLAVALLLILFTGIASCTIADLFIATAHVVESIGKGFDYVAGPVNSGIVSLGEAAPDPTVVGEKATDVTLEATESIGKGFDYVAGPVNSGIVSLGEAAPDPTVVGEKATDVTIDALATTAEAVERGAYYVAETDAAKKTWEIAKIPISRIATAGEEKPEIYDGGDPKRMNLVLGGIRQTEEAKKNYEHLAENNHAKYIPTYYRSGEDLKANENDPTSLIKDIINWGKKGLDGLSVQAAYSSIPTYDNGLANTELQGQKYETIIAYSGGTATAVAAILMQGVTCENLILISPMDAAISADDYAGMIDYILEVGSVSHIQILWSPDDHPTTEWAMFYQASTFTASDKVSIKQVDLSNSESGLNAHSDILEYAIANIRDGEFIDPDMAAAKETEKNVPVQLSGSELLDESDTENVQEITKQSKQSEIQETSQGSQQNVQETAQYSEPDADQGSSSAGTFDAYSEGKKIVEEFFASGEAEVALQEALQSSTEGSGQSTSDTSSEESNLAGINFTSIKLNSISIATDSSGGANFDLILKGEKADGTKPGINIQKATRIGAAAFMTGLEVNDNKFWVNLNPWEVDQIIDEELGESEVGMIMLEADLQMKRDFSNYGNPCANKTGKALWNLLDKKREDLVQRCMNKFPGEIKETSNIIFRPVQRHWIVPDKAYAYSNGSLIYIINASLTINSEPVTDHASFQMKNQDVGTLSRGCIEELNRSAKEYAEYCKILEERMIQPYVVADINNDEKYEDLREVYAALALAQWYKSKATANTDIFRDSLDSSSSVILKSQTPWHPKDIWDKYVYSFTNGEYKCWENTTTKTAKGTRTKISLHSAGGVKFEDIRDHLVKIEAMPPEAQDQAKRAITDGIVDIRKDVLFGYRLHLDRKKETQITGTSSGYSIESRDSNQGINDPLKAKSTVNATSLISKNVQIQSNETSSAAKVGGTSSSITCPDGWMGPDENGECWQMQITS